MSLGAVVAATFAEATLSVADAGQQCLNAAVTADVATRCIIVSIDIPTSAPSG